MERSDQIAELIAPSLASMGYELVRVQILGTRRVTLQVMAERKDGAAMTVDDCADISHAVSALLDVEDPIPEAYTLEVSSPGIDRPLIKAKDFERWAGFDAKVETSVPVNGRKRFRGKLLGMTEDRVRMAAETGDVEIPLGDIRNAKLLMTDELIAATENRH